MRLPLNNYELELYIDDNIAGFDPTRLELCKQFERLGGKVKKVCRTDDSMYFIMKSPDKISSKTTLMLFESYQANIPLEIQLQARFGLIHVHGKQKSELSFLPINYLSCVIAHQIITSLLALEYAIRKGSLMNNCTLSIANTVQNILGQYYAGASVAKPRKKSEPVLGPPFISSDDVIFEIETLDPKVWVSFCKALFIDATVASDAWKVFQSRYAKSECRLPDVLYKKLSALSFDELSQICNRYGVFVMRLDREEYTFNKSWSFEVKNTMTSSKAASIEELGITVSANPLENVKIIESCRRIQGPYATSLLGLLGAEVTRIEPIGGDFLRGMPPLINNVSPRFMALNHLKKVVEANLNKEEGKKKFFDTLSDADLFINNWAPGKAESLQLTPEDILTKNKAVSYVYAGGWGPENGHITIPGTDFVVQAATGLARKIRNGPNGLGGSLFTLIDLFGGVLAAQASLINLLSKQRDGHIAYFETSLLWGSEILLEQASASSSELELDEMISRYSLIEFYDGYLLISNSDIDEVTLSESISLLDSKASDTRLTTVMNTIDVLNTIDKRDIQYVSAGKDFPGFDFHTTNMWVKDTKNESGYMRPLSPWYFSNKSE